MAKLARDVMTADPVCCSADTTLDQIAKLMVANDCGEIPILDETAHPIGVVTDRDIVCRIIADGKNPVRYTADSCMSTPVFTVSDDMPIDEVVALMEEHRIRRVPVVDADGCCAGIISQADIAAMAPARLTAELLCQVSQESARPAL